MVKVKVKRRKKAVDKGPQLGQSMENYASGLNMEEARAKRPSAKDVKPASFKTGDPSKSGLLRAITYLAVATGDCPICGTQESEIRFIFNPYGADMLGCLACGEHSDANEVPF